MVNYDEIFAAHPGKWSSAQRDEYAFNALNKHIGEPAALLDIGCGNGHTLKYFSHRWKNTAYYGIDLSRVGIDLARKAVPSGTFEVASLLTYFPGRKFPVVVCMGVMEHFKNLPAHLQRIRGLLEPDGVVYVEAPNSLGGGTEEGYRPHGTQEEWHLKRTSWEKILTEAGLNILKAITGPGAYMEFIWLLNTSAPK